MALNPEIWGPHYWFVIQTIAFTYPNSPNEVTKKKYYDLIQNIPLFIPQERLSNQFLELLDKFPITPYLDSRESFIKWINFIHNKINVMFDKPIVELHEGVQKYYDHYKPVELQNIEDIKMRKKIIYSSIVVLAIISCFFLYNK